MGKFLLLVILGLAVYWFVFRAPRSRRETAVPRVEDMVQCARCLTHVPRGEAVSGDGKDYCCEEHRRLGCQ